jgi:hypothetical protein
MHSRVRVRLAILSALVACGLALVPAPAFADGDPASDVLLEQSLFLPTDAAASAAQQAELLALLRSAAAAGYPIRVALIASPSDLGSVTALWQQPRNYARFLGFELSLAFHGPLLVVMPGGFGLYHPGPTLRAELAALSRTPLPLAGQGFAPAVLTAIRNLAAATGRRLPRPAVVVFGHGRSPGGFSQAWSWFLFAAGLMAIGIVWALSLREKPLRLGSRSTPT